MTKKAHPKASVRFEIGDRVRVVDLPGQFGRVVEFRGNLGPGGEPVYRVMVRRRPWASYIELLDSQIELAPRSG